MVLINPFSQRLKGISHIRYNVFCFLYCGISTIKTALKNLSFPPVSTSLPYQSTRESPAGVMNNDFYVAVMKKHFFPSDSYFGQNNIVGTHIFT